ncbi:MAG: hypothetical protein AAF725_24930 [Acidobacteriota bacterium]
MVAKALAVALGALLAALPALAGSFSTAGETLGEDLILHPVGYDGTGGELVLTVCLDPADPRSAQAESAVFFAARTWNERVAATGNLRADAVPAGTLDFESTALRALGLCLGLEDPSDSQGFARATNGAGGFDRDPGVDAVAGTRDDLRGDDQSLTWFRLLDNDPLTASQATVDASTYSRDTAVLPEGDTFAATATRAAAAAQGFPETEAVMVADLRPGETKRRLTFDDIATLRYAETGLDEIAGTADDYTVRLVFLGLAAACDLRVTFDTQSAPAVCSVGASRIQDNHFGIVGNDTFAFSDAVQWHFNTQDIVFVNGFETGTTEAWSSTFP